MTPINQGGKHPFYMSQAQLWACLAVATTSFGFSIAAFALALVTYLSIHH
jgi:hypothetical protein